jgi:S1-C subfamily serine protease
VSLEGKPVQLGFSWRFDPAEPGIAIVTSVVYGSPAHEAGLQVGDRIWEVNAAAWPQEAGLAELLAKGTPLAVRYERRGQVQETELVPWSELAVSQ